MVQVHQFNTSDLMLESFDNALDIIEARAYVTR
jgi:hypothetical protein